jgi:hypothetical protein
MKLYKRQHLRQMVKLNTLARLCEIQPGYLSRVIHEHVKPSQELAEKLAMNSNLLIGSKDYFEPADFIAARFRK